MATWGEFAKAAPDLASFGAECFQRSDVAYLATARRDGWPRVHPVTPIIGAGHLFVFTEPTSPKGHDLRRDPRYALHSSVGGPDGEGGEFAVAGRATPVEDPQLRSAAVAAASYDPVERYVLFELTAERASSTVYEDGQPVRQRWTQPPA